MTSILLFVTSLNSLIFKFFNSLFQNHIPQKHGEQVLSIGDKQSATNPSDTFQKPNKTAKNYPNFQNLNFYKPMYNDIHRCCYEQ